MLLLLGATVATALGAAVAGFADGNWFMARGYGDLRWHRAAMIAIAAALTATAVGLFLWQF
jgi:hypothetical protein